MISFLVWHPGRGCASPFVGRALAHRAFEVDIAGTNNIGGHVPGAPGRLEDCPSAGHSSEMLAPLAQLEGALHFDPPTVLCASTG
jgi:hypothetical protein